MGTVGNPRSGRIFLVAIIPLLAILACGGEGVTSSVPSRVPRQERWGIYNLDLTSQAIALIYSSPNAISTARLNPAGDRIVFSQEVGGTGYEYTEIFTIGVDGQELERLTDNDVWDLYPSWSPDGARIVFLSWRGSDLDLYLMQADGSGVERLFDSGSHDADVHWSLDRITFTSGSRIWIMDDGGMDAHPITDPPLAGEWGSANLPYGDYDPRLSPNSARIAFERMVDASTAHGSYDLFVINSDGSNLIRLTETGFSQGLPSWSHDGSRIAYVVAAIDGVGQFDIYVMNADGSENRNLTPAWFPPEFLCHSAVFSADDSSLFIVGEWWEEE